MRSLALLALAASAAGCASVDAHQMTQDAIAAPGVAYNAARHALAPPQMEPVSTPAALTGGQQQTMPQPTLASSESPRANSLWRTGSRSFFNDVYNTNVNYTMTGVDETHMGIELGIEARTGYRIGVDESFGSLLERHDAVLRNAGSYDISPSPSSPVIWRRSGAWIVPSTMGSS